MGRLDSGPRPTDAAFEQYWKRREGASSRSLVGYARTVIALLRSSRSIYRVWAASPRVTVQVSSSTDGQLIASRLAYRLRGRWVARPLMSVIELPESIEDYLSGETAKSRRQNLNRANKLGITHAALPAGPRANEIYAHCNKNRDLVADGVDTAVAARGTVSMMAVDSDGEAVAVGVAVVDREDAYLSHLVAIAGRDETLPARWVIHTEILRVLIERGVRRMWSEGPLVTSMGNQMFQRRLGYAFARVRVIGTS
jgi:hypothetical protein